MKTKKNLKISWSFFLITAFLTIGLGVLGWAQDGDTYNFYFQKGQAPQTVIQGTGAQKAQNEGEASPSNLPSEIDDMQGELDKEEVSTGKPAKEKTVKALAKEIAREIENELENKWHIGVGFGYHLDELGAYSGVGVDLGYNLNRYFGFGIGGIYITGNTDLHEKHWYGVERQGETELYASVRLTPINLDLFGARALEMGVSGGVLTASHYETLGDGYYGTEFDRTTSSPFLFVGPHVNINLGRNFQIRAEGRFYKIEKTEWVQASGTLAYRF